MSTPLPFLNNMVKPAFKEWREDHLAEYKAKAVAGYINALAEEYAHSQGIQERKKISDLRDKLSAECPEFGLVRDIADGTNHRIVNRGTSRIGGAQSTKIEVHGDSEELIVTLKDGSKRVLLDLIQSSMEMWEKKLSPIVCDHPNPPPKRRSLKV
jgi:hypothetical protein